MRLWVAVCVVTIGLGGCTVEAPGAGSDQGQCDARAPVCAPTCGSGEVCGVDCACMVAPACDSGRPLCHPGCGDGLSCLADCTCGVPEPGHPTDCNPSAPVCPECAAGEFCTSDCTCAPLPCDPEVPTCLPECGDGEYCTRNCMCAPEPCNADAPACEPGCLDGQVCNSYCECEDVVCDPLAPKCDAACAEGEFCNARCECEILCNPEAPSCDLECGEDEFCGRDCRCLLREVCDADRPVCDPPCSDGKICGATCECIAPCDAQEPVCTPRCSPLEICSPGCQCELRPCDPDNPVCESECPGGEICGPSCLCQPLPECDPRAPRCDPECGEGFFCARNCLCFADGTELPDLTVDVGGLRSSLFIEERSFAENHCALVEGCVLEPGFRRLLRFSTVTPNIGTADMYMGDPRESEDLFEYSDCHGHFHFLGYAQYQLLDSEGELVARGHKQAFCLLDSTRYLTGDDVPLEAQYNCGNQGITLGWADIYGSGLDCQWIDITDVEPGAYELRVTLNNLRTIEELSYDNNVVSTHVIIPAADPLAPCVFEPNARGIGRDCGWEIAHVGECAPGDPIAVGCADTGDCDLGSCSGDPVMRVCAGRDMGCTSAQALGLNDDSCGGNCPSVNIVCPPEGVYTVLAGANQPGDEWTCEVSSQLGHILPDPLVACGSSEQGLDRNCSWVAAGSYVCEPQERLAVGCNAGDGCALGSCEGDTMLRVCAGHESHCLSNERIGTNDDACSSLCSYLEISCPDEGVVTVMSGTYRSQLESTCTLEIEGAMQCPSDALEPNDDPREAPLLGVGRVEALSLCRGEHEYYTIFANEPDRIEVMVRLDVDDVEIQIEVFSPGGESLAMSQGAGPQVRLSAGVGEAGRHRLGIRLLRGAVAPYSLEINLPLDE